MNHSTMDMQKVKTIMDDNKRLRELNNELEKKIKMNKFADEITELKNQNEILRDRLKRFETMENQNIKEEIEKNKKADLLLAKKQVNIDANKTFGIPIKNPNETYGVVDTNIISHHQNIFKINGQDANRMSLNSCTRLGINNYYCYPNKYHSPYLPTGYQVLWIPSTGQVTYVFTKEQVEFPINLREIYNY